MISTKCEKFSLLETQFENKILVLENIDYESESEIVCQITLNDTNADENFPGQFISRNFQMKINNLNDNVPS